MGIISLLARIFGTRNVLTHDIREERTVNRRERRAMVSMARRKKPRGHPHIQPRGLVFPGQRG